MLQFPEYLPFSFGYSAIRLFGYSAIRLFGYSAIRLFGYSAIRYSAPVRGKFMLPKKFLRSLPCSEVLLDISDWCFQLDEAALAHAVYVSGWLFNRRDQ